MGNWSLKTEARLLFGGIKFGLMCLVVQILMFIIPGFRLKMTLKQTDMFCMHDEGKKKYRSWISDGDFARGFAFTWEMIKMVYLVNRKDAFKSIKAGGPAPNTLVHSYPDAKQIGILDSVDKSTRHLPTVICFGSVTNFPFMAAMMKIKQLSSSFAHAANFLTVYIREVHPTDSGHFPHYFVKVNTHRSLGERFAAAKQFYTLETPSGHFVVDSMSDGAANEYAAFPNRLLIVHNGIIKLDVGCGPTNLKVNEVEDWLADYEAKTKKS